MVTSLLDRRMNKMLVYLLVAMNILAACQCGAISVRDQLQIEGLLSDIEASMEQQPQRDLSVDQAIDYAVKLGCRNLNDIILTAQAASGKSDALGAMDILEDKRSKKSVPKHTLRFGRK